MTTTMSDCVLAACGQIRDMNRAFTMFDSFAELQLMPTADTYGAIISGCLMNGLLDSIPKVR